eukprot:PhM_4_TR16481/c0_g1_i1/m.77344
MTMRRNTSAIRGKTPDRSVPPRVPALSAALSPTASTASAGGESAGVHVYTRIRPTIRPDEDIFYPDDRTSGATSKMGLGGRPMNLPPPGTRVVSVVDDTTVSAFSHNCIEGQQQRSATSSATPSVHNFHFHRSFDMTASQEDVYRVVGYPLVEHMFDGYNTSLLAYGQPRHVQ